MEREKTVRDSNGESKDSSPFNHHVGKGLSLFNTIPFATIRECG